MYVKLKTIKYLQYETGVFSTGHEEYPTMLHFAAKFGLEKLLWHLLESPGGEQACQLRNSSQMTPADVAEASNHQKLAQALRGYMQMTELTSMYSILKGISDGHPATSAKDDPDTNYLLPRPLNDSYLVPPAPRPVECSTNVVHNYTNVGSPLTSDATMFNYQVPPPPQSIFATNYQVPTNCRPYSPSGACMPPTTPPPVPSSPVDQPLPCGYLEMSSSEFQRFSEHPNASNNGFLINFYFPFDVGLGSINYLRANLSLIDCINNKTANRHNDFSVHSSRGKFFFFTFFPIQIANRRHSQVSFFFFLDFRQ